jgi:acyl-CoA synthetase (AMP-forming)/AMP-acid ligase II
MKRIIKTIKDKLVCLHIGHGIASLAILAALTGAAATMLPPENTTHSLTLISTISGAASTIISANQISNVNKK